MAENFSFKGKLNGVDYATPDAFVEALKEATANNTVRSIEYMYSSSENSESDKNISCAKEVENKKTSKGLYDPNDTISRVTKIKEIVCNVVEMADRISNNEGSPFTGEDLNSFRDIVNTSLQNVAYIISGMNASDRSDFCSRMLPGMKSLFEEADSESKDIQYEEAKYRSMLVEDNKKLEDEIKQCKKEYDENCQEIEMSENRSEAAAVVSDFFSSLLSLVQ